MDQKHFYHRMLAGLVFLTSFIIYYLTIAPTTSFWDCGEFITCCYIFGVPHPPGASLYLLVGRIFTMLPWCADIALRVNIISAIASSVTVMLTYLIIARLIIIWRGQPKKFADRMIIYGSSVVGALALAFSDSFWSNAVEAEVYSISLFFTALIVWLILVWHEKADEPSSDRYLLLISYCIGLAIGVHLLAILALPVIFLIFYFRKLPFNFLTFIIFILISAVIFFGIYPGIVKMIPNLALILTTKFSASFAAYFFILLILIVLGSLTFAIINRSRIVITALMCFLLIIIGASTFTSVYLRSKLNPAIDENDPENLENIVSYINREQYGDWSYIERRAPLWEYQIKKMYLRYYGWQFIGKGTIKDASGLLAETFSLKGLWGLPFLIGILGMTHHFFKDYKRALAILALFFLTGIAIVLYLNQPDPQPRERDYVFIGSFFAFAIWIGIGVASILESFAESVRDNSLKQKVAMAIVTGLIFIFIPVKMLAFNYHSNDRSGNYVAYDYSYNLLQSCEKDAILFTNGDNDTFPLWFLQYVHNIRTDVRVVNLSLLNTHWYIRQLRDQEPRVPINLTDNNIDQLAPVYWPESKTITIKVPREVYEKELEDLEQRKEFISKLSEAQPEITFKLGPTWNGQALRVQDIMILNIIASSQLKKPIYFAITVSRINMLNMLDNLRMDGLAFKLVTYPGEKISPSRLKENLFNKFSYRNLDNPDVYYNDNITGLLVNYRSAFLRLSAFYRQEKMTREMLETLDKMEQIIPEQVIPIKDPRLSLGIGSMYLDGGRPGELANRLERILEKPNISENEKFEYAQVFFQYLNNPERAEQVMFEIIEKNSGFLKGYYWLFNLYNNLKYYDKGLNLARQLLEIYPADQQAKLRVEQFGKLVGSTEGFREKKRNETTN